MKLFLVVVANGLAGLSGGGDQSFAGSQMVQRIAAPAIALERNAYADVKEVQDNLMLMENHVNADVKDFEERMRTGNFPAPPAGMPSSFLETEPVEAADIHKIDPKLERIETDLEAFNQHLKQEADSASLAATAGADHTAPQPSLVHEPASFLERDHSPRHVLPLQSALHDEHPLPSAEQSDDREARTHAPNHDAPLESTLHDSPQTQQLGLDAAKALADLHAKIHAQTDRLQQQAQQHQSSLLETTRPRYENLRDADFSQGTARRLHHAEEQTLRAMGDKGDLGHMIQSMESTASDVLDKSVAREPSSLLELAARLKALQSRSTAEMVAKLQADTAVPSSLAELDAPGRTHNHVLEGLEDKLRLRSKVAAEKTKDALDKLRERTKAMDKNTKDEEIEAHRMEAEMKREAGDAVSMTPGSLLETAHRIAHRRSALQRSTDPENIEQEDEKMKALLATIQDTDKRFGTIPASLLEKDPEDEAPKEDEVHQELDAAAPRLKALKNYFKHEIGQYADTQDADSSLLQQGEAEPSGFLQRLHALLKQHALHTVGDARAQVDARANSLVEDSFGAAPVAPGPLPSSWLQAAAIDPAGRINLRKH